MRGVFVTGTGTGVGKTAVAGAVCAALAARGQDVAAFKPVVTGTDEVSAWPPDHELLAAAAGGLDPGRVAPLTFGPPVSPHLAAELAGEPIEPAELIAAARAAGGGADALVVEGVGGLLVPLTSGYLVRDLARDLGLTLEAARAVGLFVGATVLTPWPADPDDVARSNRQTIARLGAVPVATLPPLPSAEPAALAQAGAQLPLDDWLG